MNVRFDFYTPIEIAEIVGERSEIGVSTVARIESDQGGWIGSFEKQCIMLRQSMS